jgi:hypothetical protein
MEELSLQTFYDPVPVFVTASEDKQGHTTSLNDSIRINLFPYGTNKLLAP